MEDRHRHTTDQTMNVALKHVLVQVVVSLNEVCSRYCDHVSISNFLLRPEKVTSVLGK